MIEDDDDDDDSEEESEEEEELPKKVAKAMKAKQQIPVEDDDDSLTRLSSTVNTRNDTRAGNKFSKFSKKARKITLSKVIKGVGKLTQNLFFSFDPVSIHPDTT